jgi:diacylglycerol kinase (ATP)
MPDATPHASSAPPRKARSLNPAAAKVLMLVNRKAGAGRGRAIVEQVIAELVAAGLKAEVINDLAELHDATQLLLIEGSLRGVLAAGGDGTIAAALNHTPLGTPLAVLPLGTENLLARYLQHLRTPRSVVDLLTRGVVVALDAARAGDRLFSIVFSAGLDAEVVRQVHEHRRGNITHLAYALPLLKSIGGYQFPKLRVTSLDDSCEEFTAEGTWAFAMNLPRYAMNLPIAPGAVGTDGLLDACVLERGTLQSGLWYLGHVLARRHHLLDHVYTARRTGFRIESADGASIPFQVDGDPGGMLPVEIHSLPERLQVIVTPEVATRLGFAAAQ